LQKMKLTCCCHIRLFVDSIPKFTCQLKSISGSHTSRRWGTRKGQGVMYECECGQKGHFFCNFLTGWSVEGTNTTRTQIRSEPNS
jgi:hypothetical protein